MSNRTIYFDKISEIKVVDLSKQYEYKLEKPINIFGITWFKGGVYSIFSDLPWLIGTDRSKNNSFKNEYLINNGIISRKPYVLVTMQDGSNTIFYFKNYNKAVDYYNEIKSKTNRQSLDL